VTGSIAQIWRHPIKGVGAEQLDSVRLETNRPLPFDRAWAILDEHGDGTDGWRPCRNFIRGAKGPSLMAVTARMEDDRHIVLSHPDRPDLAIDATSDEDAAQLIDWVAAIYPDTRAKPMKLVPAPPQGMSDADFPSVSVLGLASLRALGQSLGQTLDPRRFRGNLWIDGLGPWEEFEWVGRQLQIGDATLDVVDRIGRCRATEANPDTGRRDANTLGALEDGWQHTDFGVYARVVSAGPIATGDQVAVS